MSSNLTSSRWANTSKSRSNHSYNSEAEISAFAALASTKPTRVSSSSHKPQPTFIPTSSIPRDTPTPSIPINTATTTSLPPPNTSRLTDLHASQRLLRRLQWKANLLLISHSYATTSSEHERSLAETQFKLDFFEFFVLLERVLVHLLACLHISVHRAPTSSNGTARSLETRDGKTNIYATRGHISHPNTHRFHAHLLETLDRPSNPLHPYLGIGDVRMYLGVAKDCRNKWKDAGDRERASAHEDIATNDYDYDPPPETYTVASLNLATMLPCLLQGLERASVVVEGVVKELPEGTQGSVVLREDGAMDLDVLEKWEGIDSGIEDVEMEWG